MTDGMEERMDAIRLKQILGGTLTEQELMCLQIDQNGFGCRAYIEATGEFVQNADDYADDSALD